ncbi:MAG: tetratricopeptide repeat protein [Rhodospirillaceae bacterium]|nr:MAG: tetratricopeptide repeat protein [Rhodospirillaceae bacterium]
MITRALAQMESPASSESITALLQNAVQLHQAGRLVEAERNYDIVLKQSPEHGDALNLKGLIALDLGRAQEAINLLMRAVRAAPSYAPAYFNLGNAFAAADRTDDALACYHKACAIDPAFADAHLNAGALLEKLNRISDAIKAFRTMVSVCPSDARGYRNLALCMVKSMDRSTSDNRDGIAVEALTAFDRACALDPADADAQFEYANLLAQRGNHPNGVIHYETALKLRPDWVEAISNLGETLRKDGRFDEAVAMQRRALTHRPGDQIILTHLGNALVKIRAYEEAAEIFRGLMASDPDALLPYINLGNVYRESGRIDDAIATFEEALFRVPESYEAYGNMSATYAEQGWWAAAYIVNQKTLSIKGADAKAHVNQSLIALALGRFTEGWPGYELRFDVPEEHMPRRPTPPPYWRGEDLAGKSILLWTEQGIGDEILYAEMIPDVIACGAQCVIACSKRMVPIFARSFPETAVVGYEGSALGVMGAERFDYQSSIISLGIYLRPDFQSFPRRAGYLKADPVKVTSLRARYEALAQGRRIIGLSWRSKAVKGQSKSMALLDLGPALTTKNIFFVNLQYGDCGMEIAAARERLGVDIFQDSSVDPLSDMDTAFAQVAAMDLVITTSNTTAHTAGAQNVPVWVMLPFGKGLLWYWFIRHQTSAWYPSASLIRSPRVQSETPWWQEIMEPIASRLAAWTQSSAEIQNQSTK